MIRHLAHRDPNDQLLGEFETEVIRSRGALAAVQPGESVYLVPEPDNPRLASAIRVENADSTLLGYLPRKAAQWLFPLLVAKQIRVEGYVPTSRARVWPRSTKRMGIVVIVFQPQKIDLLAPVKPKDELQALHEMVRHTYCAAQGYQNPDLVLGLARSLRSLERQPMLPVTRLLLAMLPGSAPEVRAFHGLSAIVEFRDLLAKLSLGEPMHYENLTFVPLVWPEPRQPPYISLPQAVAGGTATIEEIAGETEDEGYFVVTNHARDPILVCGGEIMLGKWRTGVVAETVLVAGKTSTPLPMTPLSLWPSSRSAGNCHRPTAAESFPQHRSNFPTCPSAAGVVTAYAGRILGVDLFASEQTLRGVWGSLADAYLAAAMKTSPSDSPVSPADVQRFLKQLAGAAMASNLSLALGSELEIENENLLGRALLYSGHLCHLWAINK